MPFLPTEISPFLDVGLAWWGNDKKSGNNEHGDFIPTQSPRIALDRSTTDRVPVVSTGISARMNILGYIILEAYYAYPFQRPGKGAHFGFNIAPRLVVGSAWNA